MAETTPEYGAEGFPLNTVTRLDGSFTNILTGLGIPGKDKTLATYTTAVPLLAEVELRDLYKHGIIRRYVDALPNAILRHQPTIKLGGDVKDGDDTIQKFETYLQANSFVFKYGEVMRLQRLFGGAVLLLLIDDGKEPHEPVNTNTMRSIVDIVPLSREEITPDDASYTDISRPTHYRINTTKKLTDTDPAQNPNNLNYIRVHHTRVIRFDGLYLPFQDRIANTGWHMSAVQPVYEAITHYDSSVTGLANLLAQGDILVHQMPGLMQKLAGGQEDLLKKRLELNKLSISMYGMFILDKEENITNVSRNLSNVAQATQPFIEYLQAVTGWPASILMGSSPGGLGKEGRFEERVWSAIVEEWQEAYCRQALTTLFSYIFATRQGPTNGRIPPKWEVVFPTVFTETETEKAALRLQHAQADQILATLQAVDPLEIRARYSNSTYSNDLVLDPDITEQLKGRREASLTNEFLGYDAQREAYLNPPEAPGLEAPAGAEGDVAPENADVQPEENTKQDSQSIQNANGIRILITHSKGDIKAGYPVDRSNQRIDSWSVYPTFVVGPHTKRNTIYRTKINEDSLLIDGPYITGFTTLRSARAGLAKLYPKAKIAGLTAVPSAELESLRSAWEVYA